MNSNIRETFAEIHENEVVDYSGKAKRVHAVLEASIVQLAAGPAPTNLTLYSARKTSVLGIRNESTAVGILVVRPEYFGFMCSQGNSDVRINGELAQYTRLYSQGEQDGFHAVGGARTTMGIAVDRHAFIVTVAALRGVTPDDILVRNAVLQMSTVGAKRFRSGIDLQIRKAVKVGKSGTAGSGPEDADESIFGSLVEAFLRSFPKHVREYKSYPPEKIVRKAEERFFAAEGRPVCLADLCNAAGVSQSTLYRAFSHICDQPPLAYFHKRRLHSARRNLVNSPSVRGAVKRVALSTGMTELGRFSVEYRRLFGESPSTTLKRSARV